MQTSRRGLGISVLTVQIVLILLSPGAVVAQVSDCTGQPALTPCDDNDGNVCSTSNQCDGEGNCVPFAGVAYFGGPCPDQWDGNECTEPTCCLSLSCAGQCGTPKSAATPCTDDGNECTTPFCDGQGTCGTPQISGFPCDDNDGNVCGTSNNCDGSGNCVPFAGLAYNGGPCPDQWDGNECTEPTCCLSLSCAGQCGTPKSAATPCTDDGNECTTPFCDGQGTCGTPMVGFPCDDNDGNVCSTSSFCDGSGNCVDVPGSLSYNGGPCPDQWDGNECTEPTCCASPSCAGQCGIPKAAGTSCTDTDGNTCTQAECDGINCIQDAIVLSNSASCDDGTACTEPDSCQNGICVGSNPVVCTALDQCHEAGICDPATGICTDPPLLDGTPCEDGDECTVPDLCNSGACTPGPDICRVSVGEKGSLLIFSKVELKWDASGKLTQDTILTLVNDFGRSVRVKFYYVNGDAPTDAVYADDLQQILVERAHNGWKSDNCSFVLTEHESNYLVMSTGETDPEGTGSSCARFTILDPGTPPGRPNLEADGGRVLRGMVYAFAVDEEQEEISYNHLSGMADIIHYGIRSAWEYQAYAFQTVTQQTAGLPPDGNPGQINLDGVEYDSAFSTLVFDFFAVGSTALSNGGTTVMLDTDLTLHPVSLDVRQDSCGPITTKAHFDIWNANEDFRSGTARCITCWDQTLLSAYSVGNGLDNNFILADLGSDKGKARIDGQESFECDNLFVPPNLDDAILQWLLLHDRNCDEGLVAEGPGKNNIHCCRYTINDSQYAALLGVSAKVLSFTGGATGKTWAGMNLVGYGTESAQILFDLPIPDGTANNAGGRPGTANHQRSKLGQPKGK